MTAGGTEGRKKLYQVTDTRRIVVSGPCEFTVHTDGDVAIGVAYPGQKLKMMVRAKFSKSERIVEDDMR